VIPRDSISSARRAWAADSFLLWDTHEIGHTTDERPCMAIEIPVSIEDLHATIFTAMGISPKTEFSIEDRPFHATRDGHGKAISDVFA